jgi:hypothetical protein
VAQFALPGDSPSGYTIASQSLNSETSVATHVRAEGSPPFSHNLAFHRNHEIQSRTSAEAANDLDDSSTQGTPSPRVATCSLLTPRHLTTAGGVAKAPRSRDGPSHELRRSLAARGKRSADTEIEERSAKRVEMSSAESPLK